MADPEVPDLHPDVLALVYPQAQKIFQAAAELLEDSAELLKLPVAGANTSAEYRFNLAQLRLQYAAELKSLGLALLRLDAHEKEYPNASP